MLLKSTVRTILKSMGRFLAIMSIIALGVGFFSGLSVTEESMVKTAGEYISELGLYDYRLLSTLGFTDEDVKSVAGLSGVKAAYGSVSADFLASDPLGSSPVLHSHTILDGTNGLDLVSGRLPEAPNECVIDSLYAGDDAIGGVIALSEENSEDTLELFAYDEYVIVGRVNASEYLNYERGSTSIGSGSVSGFIYLPIEGYSVDYYTEIYLSLDISADIYSLEYENAVDSLREELEELTEELADRRYTGLLEDGRREIADAEQELSDGESELESAKAELSDARSEYESARLEALSELEEAKTELESARAELDEGWEKLSRLENDPIGELEEVSRAISEARAELEEGERAYSEGVLQLEEARAELDKSLEEAKNELILAQEELDSGKSELESKTESASLGLYSGWKQLEAAKTELQDARAQLEALKASPGAQYPPLSEMIAAYEREIAKGESELEAAISSYEMSRSYYFSSMEEASRQIEENQKKIDSGWEEYEEGRLEALSELEEAKTELDSARAELDEGWEELSRLENDPIGELEEVSRAISEARAELEDGERSYSQGLLDYEEAQKRVDDELSSAEMELSDAERELESASAELIDAKEKIASANEELSELEEPSVFVLDRSANIGYASLENDTAVVSGIAKVFPAFFFLVAMLVCITTMTRMVSEKRTENGILKALGYSGGAIAAQFLIYAGSASAVGCIAGFMIGSRFLPMTIWEVYRIMYLVNRPAEYVLDWGLFGICTSLYLVLALGATWLVCRRDLNENAASLMRPKAPVAGKRTIIERIGFIWKRLKFLHKISIRNILRYKKRMLMMIIGIGGCTALLIAGFGIRDSVQPIVDYQFDEITLYDAQVTLLDGTDAEELTRLSVWDEVKSYSFVRSESRDLVLPGDDEPLADTDLVVFSEPLTSLVDLHSGKEAVDWPERGEAVINYRLSREYGIKAGDAILLRASDMDSIQVTVSGVYDNYMSDCIYISSETYENSCKESPEMNTAYIIFNEDSDESRAAASLLSSKQVAAVTLSSDMRTRVKNMLENLNYIVFIVLVCAGALAFIVVYNLTNITITERTREIATLKVLGFYQNEQDSYVFRENILLTGISALCGIPMGIALLNYVMAQVKISNMYFGCRLSPLSYILSIVITFLFTIIVDGVLMLRTRRINMAEAMKAIE